MNEETGNNDDEGPIATEPTYVTYGCVIAALSVVALVVYFVSITDEVIEAFRQF